MRECPNCRKVNLATRKFCIRCGASLLKPIKERPEKAKPTPESTTTFETQAPPAETLSPTTKDKWVRPSQVSRDRVRHVEHSSKESEFEKAKKAFARAEEVGIDEEGTGIIETRMLRASEVKELLEGPSEMGASQPVAITEDYAEVTPESEVGIQTPSAEDMEQQILGQWSTLVDRESTSTPEHELTEPADSHIRTSATETTGFSSARYTDSSTEPIEESPTVSAKIETPPKSPKEFTEKDEVQVAGLTAEDVITCPQCKSIITLDKYEYPSEIYSAMGQARLKQARYLVVQGKEMDAKKIVKIARVLFERANDGEGLAQLEELDASLDTSS